MLRLLMILSLLVAGATPVFAGSEMDPWKALQRGEFEAAQAKWLRRGLYILESRMPRQQGTLMSL